MLYTVLAALLFSAVASACSAHTPHSHHLNATIHRRDLESLDGRDLHNRWFSAGEASSKGPVHAWPQTCSDPVLQPVRYCWADERSAKTLGSVLEEAIKRWTPAWSDGTNKLSALQIVLDPGCNGNKECQCSDPSVAKDALMISDETKEGDHDWNDGPDCQTVTTTGYTHTAENEPDRPFRHTLKFCHYEPSDNNRNFANAVRAMMHELGHAIGLGHEHQRPDRDQYLWFKPKYLLGYDQAVQAVTLDPQAFFEDDLPLDRRLSQAARSGHIALHYFPNAVDYAKADLFENHDVFASFVAAGKFDYKSIMIYSSTTGANAKGKKVIWRKDTGEEVWMGGHPEAEKCGISEGDVARVAQLYDAQTEAGEKAKKGDIWGQGGAPSRLKVRVLGGEEGVVVTPKGRKDMMKRNEL